MTWWHVLIFGGATAVALLLAFVLGQLVQRKYRLAELGALAQTLETERAEHAAQVYSERMETAIRARRMVDYYDPPHPGSRATVIPLFADGTDPFGSSVDVRGVHADEEALPEEEPPAGSMAALVRHFFAEQGEVGGGGEAGAVGGVGALAFGRPLSGSEDGAEAASADLLADGDGAPEGGAGGGLAGGGAGEDGHAGDGGGPALDGGGDRPLPGSGQKPRGALAPHGGQGSEGGGAQ